MAFERCEATGQRCGDCRHWGLKAKAKGHRYCAKTNVSMPAAGGTDCGEFVDRLSPGLVDARLAVGAGDGDAA